MEGKGKVNALKPIKQPSQIRTESPELQVLLLLEPDRFPRLGKELSARQIPSIRLSLTETKPIKHNTLLWQAVCQIKQYDWALFFGSEETETFFSMLACRKIDVRGLGHLKLAAASRGAEQSLVKRGLFPACAVGKEDKRFSERLLQAVCPKERLLIPYGRLADERCLQKLSAAGVAYDCVPLFQTVWSGERLPEIWKRVVIVTDNPVNLDRLAQEISAQQREHAVILCLSEAVQKKAKQMGLCAVLPGKYTCPAIIAAIMSIGGAADEKENHLSGRSGDGKSVRSDRSGEQRNSRK